MKVILWILGIIAVIFVLSSLGVDSKSESVSSGRFDEYSGYEDDSSYDEDLTDVITSDNWECTSHCSGAVMLDMNGLLTIA